MKSKFLKYLIACCVLFSSCHNDIWDAINALDARVTKLEEICKEMNTNITSLQAIVTVIQTNDQIENVTPITKDGNVIGYVITFTKHEPITIYNGTDGKDGKDGRDGTNGSNGANGKDGKDGNDGITPVIGVAQDTDGVYYWTLNGEWLLDNNGNKLRVTGENGQDGLNGQDGTNGVTPQLTIDEGYWYISYDGGITWTQLGKATGNDGNDGQDGDNIFQSVTQDANFVYFSLTNGTIITIKKYDSTSENASTIIVDGAIISEFSVSTTKKVYFSQGNLQYQASTNTWRFAQNQYDWIGVSNDNRSATYSGWIDLFAYGTSGYNLQYPYLDLIEEDCPQINSDIALTNYDWGVYNPISNGGNVAGEWRTLTRDEWSYLISRTGRHFLAKVNSERGLVLLPDTWVKPSGITITQQTSAQELPCSSNVFSLSQWKTLEEAGAVFIPITSLPYSTSSYPYSGRYWSGSAPTSQLYFASYEQSNLTSNTRVGVSPTTTNTSNRERISSGAVRLVKDVVE